MALLAFVSVKIVSRELTLYYVLSLAVNPLVSTSKNGMRLSSHNS